MVKPVVNWNLSASRSLKKAYDHILKDSYQKTHVVRDGIRDLVDSLVDHPGKYPLDKYKMDNPGNYRAFEAYSYRIAYKHTDKEIRILRVRHVKKEPKQY